MSADASEDLSAVGLTPESIVAGLRAWAAHRTSWVGAAVELLIWHERWLRRRDFLADATRYYPYEGMVAIRWDDAQNIHDTARGSTSELDVLQAAIDLGTDRYGIAGLGSAHRQALADAFTAAAGAR